MSNNEMYRLYNEMVKGYKENQDGLFEHAVRCWMDLDPTNPFSEEDPAYEEFFLMKKGYTTHLCHITGICYKSNGLIVIIKSFIS